MVGSALTRVAQISAPYTFLISTVSLDAVAICSQLASVSCFKHASCTRFLPSDFCALQPTNRITAVHFNSTSNIYQCLLPASSIRRSTNHLCNVNLPSPIPLTPSSFPTSSPTIEQQQQQPFLRPMLHPTPFTSSASPFVDLGPDIFELLLAYLCGESLSTAISTDAYRRLLPFAICCTQHYHLTIRSIKGLSLLPLHFTQRSSIRSALPVPPFPVALYSFYSPAYHHYSNQSSRRALGFTIHPPSRTASLDVHLPRAVKSFPNLRTLHIYRTTRLSNRGFNALILSLPNLRQLLVSANHHLTLDAIRDLPSCTQLQTLELSYCTGLGDEQSVQGGQLIAKLTQLRTLSVAYWNIADQFVEQVSQLPHLETLDLSMCNRLTSRSCFHLARNAKRLRHLKFRCSMHLTDSGLRALAACSTLQSVNFSLARRISDAGVQLFGDANAMPNLRTVLLSQCQSLTDAAVSHLSSNQAIRRLDMSYCQCLTARIAQPLARLRNLEEIDLTGCHGITDQVVYVLTQCASLRNISLAYCSQLTDASVSALCSSAHKYNTIDLRKCCGISESALTELSSRCKTLKSALEEQGTES